MSETGNHGGSSVTEISAVVVFFNSITSMFQNAPSSTLKGILLFIFVRVKF
jgi:hypothetical protein